MSINKKEALNLLGFSNSDSPSINELKKSWKKLAKIYHPDINKELNASAKFKKIKEAYDYLLKYHHRDNQADNRDFYFKESFNKKNAYRKKRKKECPPDSIIRPKDLHLGSIRTSLESFFFGDQVEFDITVIDPCEDCLKDRNIWVACGICKEIGYIYVSDIILGFKNTKCKLCKGKGWLRKTTCLKCNGRLVATSTRKITFSIPENYKTGETMVVKGQGNKGWNYKNGNVLCTPVPVLYTFSSLSADEIKTLRSLLKKGKGRYGF